MSAPAAAPAQATLERVDGLLSGMEARPVPARDGLATLALPLARLRAALERLKDPGGFEQMTLVTAVDRLPREPRFTLVHQLRGYARNELLRLETALPGDDPRAPSCIDLWPGAAYMERECYDLFGVRFDGHAGLKRLLMPEGYGHHPLRKDFPHHGIEPDRLYREWDASRRASWTPDA